MERNPWLNALIILLVIIAGLYIFGELWALAMSFSDILLLFFLAWLLAFILSPVARFLTSRASVPRILAVALVYIALIVVIFAGSFLLVPVITLQLSQLGTVLSRYSDQVPGWIAWLQGELVRRDINVDLTGFYKEQQLSAQVGQLGTLVIQNAIGIVTGVASATFNVFLVLVLSFYMMIDGSRMLGQLVAAVPEPRRTELRFFLQSVERTFGGFILGQFIQCLLYGIGTAIIMVAAGLSYVLVSSIFAGIMMLIPFVGPMVAVVPPLLIAATQGDLTKVIAVAVALLGLQQIVINVVAPRVLSEAVGLPPLLVLFALLLGAKVAGLLGALFGVPVVAVMYAMFIFLYRRSPLPEAAGLKPEELAPEVQAARPADGDKPGRTLGGPGEWISRRLAKTRGTPKV